MIKQHTRLGLLAVLVAPLAALGAWSVGHAAPAPAGPRAAPAPKSAPVRLRLSVAGANTGPVEPGDLLRYRMQAENTGAAPVTGLVVTEPVPAGTVYVSRSAEGDAAGPAQVTYSLDGHRFSEQPTRTVLGADGAARTVPAPPESYAALRWRFPALAAKTTLAVTYQVRVR